MHDLPSLNRDVTRLQWFVRIWIFLRELDVCPTKSVASDDLVTQRTKKSAVIVLDSWCITFAAWDGWSNIFIYTCIHVPRQLYLFFNACTINCWSNLCLNSMYHDHIDFGGQNDVNETYMKELYKTYINPGSNIWNLYQTNRNARGLIYILLDCHSIISIKWMQLDFHFRHWCNFACFSCCCCIVASVKC